MKKLHDQKRNDESVIEGYFSTHDIESFYGHVVIDKKGIIKKVAKGSSKVMPDHVYGKECIIFPAMGDIHIHAREDETGKQTYKEDYTTASMAGLSGGVVHVSAMPNTPIPLIKRENLKWHRDRIAILKKKNHIQTDVFNYIGIDKTTKPIGKPGDYFYKLYFGKSVGDLTVTYGSELDVILSRYKKHHVSFHVEYEPIVTLSSRGKTHSDRRPVACVNEGLRLLLPLIEKYKIKAKLCHWSTGGESFDMIQEYRKIGCDITLEVSPLHLLFDTSMTDLDPSLWLKIQMNPAIQSKQHRMELIKALKSGFIEYLATDHAPHTEEEKYSAFSKYTAQKEYKNKTNLEIATTLYKKNKKEFLDVCCENGFSGAPWLDTYALVALHLIKEYKFSKRDIARVTSYLPGKYINTYFARQVGRGEAKHYGKGFGKIEKGYIGSFTILDTKTTIKVTRKSLKTKVGWSPLEDWTFPGSIKNVIHFGKVIK